MVRKRTTNFEGYIPKTLTGQGTSADECLYLPANWHSHSMLWSAVPQSIAMVWHLHHQDRSSRLLHIHTLFIKLLRKLEMANPAQDRAIEKLLEELTLMEFCHPESGA